jgi:hypothetical protein
MGRSFTIYFKSLKQRVTLLMGNTIYRVSWESILANSNSLEMNCAELEVSGRRVSS